jgi:hypothetical protein
MFQLEKNVGACRTVLLASFILAAGASAVIAKDLKQLAHLLSTPYLAERYVVACTQVEPAFREATRGPLGDVQAYREHFEAEIFDGLSIQEAAVVSRTAHQAAKLVFDDSVQRMKSIPGYDEAEKARTWCKIINEAVIQKMIAMHDRSHASIDKTLAEAKQ